MKQSFWFSCAIILFALASGALFPAVAQTASPTPDSFVVQLTNSPAGFYSFVSDFTANGRFAVFESNGNVATQNKNNADGNREIFLIDYAQRRIFQITNTRSVQNPPASPTPTPTPTPTPSPTPSPSPTPTPIPTPEDQTLVKVLIENKSAMITLAPQVVGGVRTYTIVFSSNAPNPGNFDGTDSQALVDDGNQEIWIYQIPAVADVDLTLGQDLPFQDLSAGTFTQITNTTASRATRAGSSTALPFYADDNREGTISDDGRIIAFTSTRNLVPAVGNTDANPEIFFFNRTSSAFVQGTNTADATVGIGFTFQQNPNLSSDGSVVSFLSTANLAGNNSDGNGELFIAAFSGSAMTNVRQVTRTLAPANGQNVNILSPGRRMSRDGSAIAFECLATDPKANSSTNANFLAAFVYAVGSDTFAQVGLRALAAPGDIAHFPTFTDYNASTLAPGSVVFASALNFRADGSFPEAAQDAEGLNPQRAPQVFATTLPVSTSSTFVRVSNIPSLTAVSGMRPMTSQTRKRTVFSIAADLGGGNGANDFSTEVFYLLSPQVTNESSAVLTFSTGASDMPVADATPVPSPTPSPTPTPSPAPGVALGLAPGQLSIVRSTVELAPSSVASTGGNENTRSPALPIELNGVSVSINGAAAGLYFVGASEKQINFVIPISLSTGLGNVAVNVLNAGANTDTVFHGLVQIVAAQPDIFSSSNGAGGTAAAANVTNPNNRMPPPFPVTSVDSGGNTVPTVIELSVTGVRQALPGEITVTVGTTVITGSGNVIFVGSNPAMPGFDIINFTLPPALAGAGDLPVVVTFTRSTTITTSRPADTAPKITIN